MVNHDDRTTRWRWEIDEITDFILNSNDEKLSETIKLYRDNYESHLARLLELNQIIIQRKDGISGVCGWIRVKEDEQDQINKITWTFPEDISSGDILHISICAIKGGNIFDFKRELRRFNSDVKEICWFNLPNNKFRRMKNLLKEE